MRRVPFAAAVVVLVALVAGCTAAAPDAEWRGPTDSAPGGPIQWTACQSVARKVNPSLPSALEASCGSVTVPADWSTAKDGKATNGKTMNIALMRIHSTRETSPLGSVVLNPGGPGASGFDFVAQIAPRLTDLLTRFDLIGFDPRGVGRSDPVDCISDSDLDAAFGYDPDPTSDASYQGLVTLDRHIAASCEDKYGADLKLFSTRQAANDMDAIRAGLGEPKLNYLGFSYGTLLGATYAQLYPTHIRAMVLDGAVDPTQDAVASSEGQAKGFERAFDNFSAWCKANAGQCPISADPRGAVVNAINAARTNPPTGPDGRKATSGWVFLAVVSSLYSEDAWPYLARAIATLPQGNTQYTFLLADSYAERNPDGSFSNLFDANSAVNCADGPYPTPEAIRTLQSQWRTTYPLFGAPLATGLLGCSVWPAAKDPYPTGEAKGAPPIVVVGTTGDPATPYESTAKLADMLGVGTVVTWQGEGHTAYPETACVRTAVDQYFIALTVPAKGLTCPAR